MNVTTPVNLKFQRMIESEDIKNMNTGFNTQHSFSSFLTNQNNGTSNGSSFLASDDKKHPHTSNTGNFHFQGQNQNPPKPTNIVNSNTALGATPKVSQSLHHNDLHANSVDFSNQSPYRMNSTTSLNSANKFFTQTNFSNYNYFQDYDQRNFLTPRHFVSSNPYAYSFTLENNIYRNCMDPMNPHTNPNNNTHINIPSNRSFFPMPVPPMKFNPNEDKSVLDNLLILIKDQNGCRMIQKKLEEKKEDFITKFYEKTKPNINEIICDQFGNYVIQKFVECCGDKNIISNLLEKIKPKIYSVSTNCYGTRGFQRLLDFISDDNDYEIIKEYLTNNVFNLIKDVNGNHVIQKIIQIYPVNRNHFIFEEVIQNIVEISKLKQGSCIFQKLVEKASDSDKVS